MMKVLYQSSPVVSDNLGKQNFLDSQTFRLHCYVNSETFFGEYHEWNCVSVGRVIIWTALGFQIENLTSSQSALEDKNDIEF